MLFTTLEIKGARTDNITSELEINSIIHFVLIILWNKDNDEHTKYLNMTTYTHVLLKPDILVKYSSELDHFCEF